MRAYLGRMRTGESAIAFPLPTLFYGDRPARKEVLWWPIRRIFGLGGKRFVVALIVVGDSEYRQMDPAADATGTRGGAA